MNADLRELLLETNPWLLEPGRLADWLARRLPERLVPRLLADDESGRWSDARKAHLVVGPRQAGKSTLLWAWLQARNEPVLFLNCEHALVRGLCRAAPLFLAEVAGLTPRLPTLLFDEVQHLDEAGLFLKGLVDHPAGVPVLVTGSSSFHLGARTRESLAGRATRTRLLPFSLAEVSQDTHDSPPALREHVCRERFERHVTFGGYPEAWLAATPGVVLRDLIEAFVIRDASDLFRIARVDAFRDLLPLLAGQIGSLVNVAEWAAILAVSRETVASYLSILEESHVIATLRPYVGGKRAELTSRPKVYFLDVGLRNQLVHDLRPLGERADRGPLLETWVFTEIAKTVPWDTPIHYWRSASGAEVDFVVRFPHHLTAVEVKAAPLRRPTLPRAARSFIEAYRPASFLLVNLALRHEERLGETRVRWLRPWELAEALGE